MNPGPNSIAQRLAGALFCVLANLHAATFKPGGVTLDWSTVTANVGVNATGTITISATGGTFTVSYGGQTTGAIAFNAAPDVLETALEALSSIGNGNVRIGGVAGAYTYEFVADLRRTPITAVTTNAGSLTGGSGTATVAVTQAGLADAVLTLPGNVQVPIGEKYIAAGTVLYKLGNSRYGPASNSTTLVNGETFVVNRHYFQSIDSDQIGEVFNVGDAISARLRVGGSTQPTLANLLTACPGIRALKD